jgi:hypothetical protein
MSVERNSFRSATLGDKFAAENDPGTRNGMNSETMKEASVDRNVKRL